MMTKTLVAILASFMVMVTAGSGLYPVVAMSGKNVVHITEENNGQVFRLRVGEKFLASIRDPASAGYNIITPVYDASVLRVVSREKLAQEPSPFPRFGGNDRIVFKMEVIGSGKTRLIIRIARDWEVNVAPQDSLSVKIVTDH